MAYTVNNEQLRCNVKKRRERPDGLSTDDDAETFLTGRAWLGEEDLSYGAWPDPISYLQRHSGTTYHRRSTDHIPELFDHFADRVVGSAVHRFGLDFRYINLSSVACSMLGAGLWPQISIGVMTSPDEKAPLRRGQLRDAAQAVHEAMCGKLGNPQAKFAVEINCWSRSSDLKPYSMPFEHESRKELVDLQEDIVAAAKIYLRPVLVSVGVYSMERAKPIPEHVGYLWGETTKVYLPTIGVTVEDDLVANFDKAMAEFDRILASKTSDFPVQVRIIASSRRAAKGTAKRTGRPYDLSWRVKSEPNRWEKLKIGASIEAIGTSWAGTLGGWVALEKAGEPTKRVFMSIPHDGLRGQDAKQTGKDEPSQKDPNQAIKIRFPCLRDLEHTLDKEEDWRDENQGLLKQCQAEFDRTKGENDREILDRVLKRAEDSTRRIEALTRSLETNGSCIGELLAAHPMEAVPSTPSSGPQSHGEGQMMMGWALYEVQGAATEAFGPNYTAKGDVASGWWFREKSLYNVRGIEPDGDRMAGSTLRSQPHYEGNIGGFKVFHLWENGLETWEWEVGSGRPRTTFGQPGDEGGWVYSPHFGLLGLVVAVTGTGRAVVTPMAQIFRDIEERTGWTPKLPDPDARVDSHEGTSAR